MNRDFIKIIIFIFSFVIILLLISVFNKNVIKNMTNIERDEYKNEMSQLVNNNDVEKIDYDYVLKDLNEIDEILKKQLAKDVDKKKKSEYYAIAEHIYSNKINEIIMLLNEKLDDEDFYILQKDLDEFYKNLEYASDEIKKANESTVDATYYINKYFYEEKKIKCRNLINTYKGFFE